MQMTYGYCRTAGYVAAVGCALLLQACISSPPPPPPAQAPAPPSAVPGTDPLSVPDAVPRVEPLSTRGNPAFYEVMGKRYFVQQSAAGYLERGVASWYGPGFHEENTSNGERYDMYAMTAAHKTLPLPSYVQVTNLSNGKSIIVRVNDRGPFKDGRIIDLSLTAAAKLDMQRAGTALVEVRAITPGQSALPNGNAIKSLYVQAGAFGAASNADRLVAQLRSKGYPQAQVRSDMVAGRSMYRVRIGPIADVPSFDRVVAELKTLGIADARLALD
jgi:rare lipoprotein A